MKLENYFQNEKTFHISKFKLLQGAFFNCNWQVPIRNSWKIPKISKDQWQTHFGWGIVHRCVMNQFNGMTKIRSELCWFIQRHTCQSCHWLGRKHADRSIHRCHEDRWSWHRIWKLFACFLQKKFFWEGLNSDVPLWLLDKFHFLWLKKYFWDASLKISLVTLSSSDVYNKISVSGKIDVFDR